MSGMKSAACLMAAAFWLSIAPALAVVPVEAFAVLPDNQPSISPDGKYFAMIREAKGRPVVAIYEIGGNKPPVVISSADLLINNIVWAKDDVLLIYSRVNKTIGLYDDKSGVRTLFNATAVLVKDNKQVKLWAYSDIKDLNLDDPDKVIAITGRAAVRMNVRTGSQNDVVAYDKLPTTVAWSGKVVQTSGTDDWYFDGHGNAVARTDWYRDAPYDVPRGKLKLMVPDGSSWREIATYPYTSDKGAGIVGVGEDGKSLIRYVLNPKGTAAVHRVDLANGAETLLFNDPKYDDFRTFRNDWSGRVEGVGVVRDLIQVHYFGPQMQSIQKGIEGAFPGLEAIIVSSDRSRNRVIVQAEGPRSPPAYYLLDRTTHQANSIVATYPQLEENMLGEVKVYPYKARDGLDIDAYLTLPPGKDPKNLPMVVMPHGGPDSRDNLHFDWWAQFMANRGYAVLQPNYRGSDGYGRPFTEAGLNQWGLKMQDDISDGVKKVIADGIADPKRVCIVGASYGGYAALAGATLTPNLYACAVSFAGVSHLPNILGYSKLMEGQDITNENFWVTRIGDAFKDADRLKATSPALQAQNATAPILLIHSELDNTVPISQSIMMEKALRDAGKKVEFIRIPGDDHHLSVASTRVTVLREIERFLKANIGN